MRLDWAQVLLPVMSGKISANGCLKGRLLNLIMCASQDIQVFGGLSVTTKSLQSCIQFVNATVKAERSPKIPLQNLYP